MVLPSSDGTPTRYYAHAGGRLALLVLADQACVARLQALAEGLRAIGDAHLTVYVVGPPALVGHDLPFPLLQDPDGRAAAAYRTGGAPTAFLLDPNLRIRATLPFADGARVAADVAELVAELVWDDRRPREITTSRAEPRGRSRAAACRPVHQQHHGGVIRPRAVDGWSSTRQVARRRSKNDR